MFIDQNIYSDIGSTERNPDWWLSSSVYIGRKRFEHLKETVAASYRNIILHNSVYFGFLQTASFLI